MRMLGRFCAGGCSCRDCGNGQPNTRWRKRVEQREAEAEIREWAEAALPLAAEVWPEWKP